MRKLLLIFALLYSTGVWAGTCGNGYSFSRQVVLQRAVGSDQTNFVYSAVITYAPLKTAANGGQVQNTAANAMGITGPADMVLCDAASAGNPISYEISYYSATAGVAEVHWLMSTLHTATNDSIYLFLNNSGVSTTQQDSGLGTATNFWSTAGYLVVCHEPDGTTLNVACSLSVGTSVNHSATAVAGQLDGAASFTSAGSKWIDLGGTANSASLSVELWFKNITPTAQARPISNGQSGTLNGYELAFGADGVTPVWIAWSAGTPHTCNGTAFTTGVWSYFVGTITGTTLAVYNDGVATTTGCSGSNAVGSSTANLNLSRFPNDGAEFCNCSLDEVRVATSADTANRVSTNYNIQSATSSTYKIVEPSYSIPTPVQTFTCGSVSVNASCPSAMPITSSGYIVVAMTDNNGGCGTITDTLGLTYTKHAQAEVIGTNNYFSCIYSAPITATGNDTLTLPIGSTEGVWGIIYEVKAITASGIATATTVANQPDTMTATSPSSNAFLVCDTIGGPASSTTPAYTLTTRTLPPHGGVGFGNDSAAWGVVGSGSQSCSFNSGVGGAMAIFGNSPSTSLIRHRVVNQ